MTSTIPLGYSSARVFSSFSRMIPDSLYAGTITVIEGSAPSRTNGRGRIRPRRNTSMGKPAYANAIHPADTQNAVRIVRPCELSSCRRVSAG